LTVSGEADSSDLGRWVAWAAVAMVAIAEAAMKPRSTTRRVASPWSRRRLEYRTGREIHDLRQPSS